MTNFKDIFEEGHERIYDGLSKKKLKLKIFELEIDNYTLKNKFKKEKEKMREEILNQEKKIEDLENNLKPNIFQKIIEDIKRILSGN